MGYFGKIGTALARTFARKKIEVGIANAGGLSVKKEHVGELTILITLFESFGSKLAIHRASVPLYSLLLFTGHYGATGAL